MSSLCNLFFLYWTRVSEREKWCVVLCNASARESEMRRLRIACFFLSVGV